MNQETPIRLYLADDDVDDRELFIDALSEISIAVEISQFENGVELMAELFSDKSLPDVIYLDVHMPMMDGFECLKDIRNSPEFSAIEIIMYSTSHNKEEIEGLRKAGANQYIRKPCSFEQLKTILSKSLRMAEDRSSEKYGSKKFEILI